MAREIVVIGSVAWDEVVTLKTPLRPGTHHQGRPKDRRVGGGAANTALALVRGGDAVALISAVGADAEGEALVAALAREGVATARIAVGSTSTTHSLVLLDAMGARTIVNLARARLPLPADVCSADTAALYVRSREPALAALLTSCLDRCLVIAHVPPLGAGVRPAHILVGSRDDLDPGFLSDPWRGGAAVGGPALRWVVITHGAEGAVAYGRDEVLRQAAPTVAVVDSTGAGDVFAAGLLHALVRDASMAAALRCAVAWGAASVQYPGTVPPATFPPDVGPEAG